MATQYLGKTTGICTSEELRSLIGLASDTSDIAGDISFMQYLRDDGNTIYLADRPCILKVSWNDLNNIGCLFGKDVMIGNSLYKCRTMQGMTGDPSSTVGREWTELIANLVPSDSDSNWISKSTLFQETTPGSPTYCQVKYGSTHTTTSSITKSSKDTSGGWRPLLELIDTYVSLNITDENKGELLSPINIDYIAEYDSTCNITEKLDGNIIRVHENQTGANNYSVDLISIWGTLGYGKHTVEIIATGSFLTKIVTITFNKIKAPIQKLPANASLVERANFTNEMNKEIDYQLFKLKSNLIDKGVEVVAGDKMSSLIDLVKNIYQGKKWASGTSVKSSTTSKFTYLDGTSYGTSNFYEITINGFVPSLVVLFSKITSNGNEVVSVMGKNYTSSTEVNSIKIDVHTKNSSGTGYNFKLDQYTDLGNGLYRFMAISTTSTADWIAFE